MGAKRRLREYIYHLLAAIDQLFNAITGGAADETLLKSHLSRRAARPTTQNPLEDFIVD